MDGQTENREMDRHIFEDRELYRKREISRQTERTGEQAGKETKEQKNRQTVILKNR